MTSRRPPPCPHTSFPRRGKARMGVWLCLSPGLNSTLYRGPSDEPRPGNGLIRRGSAFCVWGNICIMDRSAMAFTRKGELAITPAAAGGDAQGPALVTAIMGHRGMEAYLGEAVASILGQT